MPYIALYHEEIMKIRTVLIFFEGTLNTHRFFIFVWYACWHHNKYSIHQKKNNAKKISPILQPFDQ